MREKSEIRARVQLLEPPRVTQLGRGDGEVGGVALLYKRTGRGEASGGRGGARWAWSFSVSAHSSYSRPDGGR